MAMGRETGQATVAQVLQMEPVMVPETGNALHIHFLWMPVMFSLPGEETVTVVVMVTVVKMAVMGRETGLETVAKVLRTAVVMALEPENVW
jgi:hypothetical protein